MIDRDPWDPQPETAQPLLTLAEYEAIVEAIWDAPWNDPSRFPACLMQAVTALGLIALEQGTADLQQMATQAMRRMMLRTLIGEFQHEVETHE